MRHLLIVALLLQTACNQPTPESRASRSAGKPSDQEDADGKPKNKKKGVATSKDLKKNPADHPPKDAPNPDPTGQDGGGAGDQVPRGDDQDQSQKTGEPDTNTTPTEPTLPVSSLTWDGETVSGTSTLHLLPTE